MKYIMYLPCNTTRSITIPVKFSKIYLYLCHPEINFLKIHIVSVRQLTLYATDDGSRQGFFFHVGGKKNKNKISWQDGVGGKKMKKKREN